jgi:hypothetical protein
MHGAPEEIQLSRDALSFRTGRLFSKKQFIQAPIAGIIFADGNCNVPPILERDPPTNVVQGYSDTALRIRLLSHGPFSSSQMKSLNGLILSYTAHRSASHRSVSSWT